MYIGLVMLGREQIHTTEPLVLKPSSSEVETATARSKRY
jgi:hypothetical protein